MRKILCTVLLAIATASPFSSLSAEPIEIPNRLIDAKGFLRDIDDSQKLRATRRVTEAQFLELMAEPGTIVLDARSLQKFSQMHIKGARHLDFTEFTAETLSAVIPSKTTKILIYCNNNIENEARAFPTKSFVAALNLSTYTSLFSYGYQNVFELGPVIDPAISKIEFEGQLKKVIPR